jgi:type IV/VI secretion system ImpK/VasF family protein
MTTDLRREYATELFRLASPLFLYLVSFRRKVSKGYQVSQSMVNGEVEEIFARMDRESRRDPKLDALFHKAKYPLAVLADEVLIHSNWEHSGQWEPLEMRYFSSNVGGDRIFEIASELQYDEVEMAAILYTAICLGVQGTYHHRPEKLTEIKNKLYRQMSEYVAEVQRHITPDAYHVNDKEPVKLSRAVTLGRVAIVTFGLVLLYWFVARVVWSGLVSDLRELVNGLIT